jgi:hypothetical protein
MDVRLEAMDRDMIKGIVMKGAEACVKEMQALIGEYHHVKTGQMQKAVAPAKYHEDLGSGWVDVYPQGNDSRGISNAVKAFVINYRTPKHRPAKTGDKFITKNQKRMERGVFTAMQEESDRRIAELNR